MMASLMKIDEGRLDGLKKYGGWLSVNISSRVTAR
jgi:hypothetical protein